MPNINLNTGEITVAPALLKAISPDSKQRIPDNKSLSGNNGVQLPGPMSHGYEDGWDTNTGRGDTEWDGGDAMLFADGDGDGLDHSAPEARSRMQGSGATGSSRDNNEPPTNQDFGVASDSGGDGTGDMQDNAHVFGTVGDNTSGVRYEDIMRVFEAVGSGGSGGGRNGGSVQLPGQAMHGIPLGYGSGAIGGYDASTGDSDGDGY